MNWNLFSSVWKGFIIVFFYYLRPILLYSSTWLLVYPKSIRSLRSPFHFQNSSITLFIHYLDCVLLFSNESSSLQSQLRPYSVLVCLVVTKRDKYESTVSIIVTSLSSPDHYEHILTTLPTSTSCLSSP